MTDRTVYRTLLGTLYRARGYTVPLIVLSLLSLSIFAEDDPETPRYRTDENNDESLEWYQLEGNEFPLPGTAHYISGELIQIDHLERKFILRADRTDDHRRSHFDLPLAATMLPYGSIWYHGAPAALEDIPLGTHLHGHFYLKDPQDKSKPVEGWHGRVTPEADFNRCFQLQDDFSFYHRSNRIWRIDSVDLEEQTLTATLSGENEEPKVFDLDASTRVWKEKGFAKLEDLEVGQEVQFNLTWATLYGPGRLVEIWIDDESRGLAIKLQRTKHLIYQKQRGLAGRVDEVDNYQRIVTIHLFGNVDPELYEAFQKDDQVGVAVARQSLMTYDPVNDRKRGPILEIEKVDVEPGGSGIRLIVKPDLLLEGYRPGRIVRVYPSSWPVIALPKEEQYFGRY